MVKEKYQSVLDLGEKLNIQNGDVQINGDTLEIRGTAATPYHKNLLLDEIKKIGGASPSDLIADIKVADESIYAKHVVKNGESLSLIATHYFKNPLRYRQIFVANIDILKNPDLIHTGQELVIPNL
ncbi:LysM peptidoglycan-binding domain-containing protein [Nonlabens sp.]|uniref:LysM peptidoglycan-binding domain-containing protein n=1 Tax=Nonlabens sp. TaxID=1888209 RepID=UPI0025F6AC22|nr:LysM peptidoglycan-binding domain-containing protein [Nonlabens sp.]